MIYTRTDDIVGLYHGKIWTKKNNHLRNWIQYYFLAGSTLKQKILKHNSFNKN